MLRRQYSGVTASVTGAASTVEIHGTVVRLAARPSIALGSREASGAICTLWKAYDTGRNRQVTPAAVSVLTSVSTAAGSPEITVARGPLIAASETVPS